MPDPTTFADHADQYRNAAEAMEASTQEQFRLKDEIGYADKEIAALEHAELVSVIEEWAKSERKPNNAEERKTETSKRLATSGPYLDAVRDRMEQARQLMHVTARYDFDRRMKRLAELHMLWLIEEAKRARA